MEQERKIVLFDCDDTLLETKKTFYGWYERTYGKKFGNPDKLTEIRRWDEFCITGNADDIEPVEEAVEVVQELKKQNDLGVLTARADLWHEITRRNIERYFPLSFFEIYHIHLNYTGPDNGWTTLRKADLCAELGAYALVDDTLERFEGCKELGIEGYFFNRNGEKEIPKEVIVFHSLKEFLNKFKQK